MISDDSAQSGAESTTLVRAGNRLDFNPVPDVGRCIEDCGVKRIDVYTNGRGEEPILETVYRTKTDGSYWGLVDSLDRRAIATVDESVYEYGGIRNLTFATVEESKLFEILATAEVPDGENRFSTIIWVSINGLSQQSGTGYKMFADRLNQGDEFHAGVNQGEDIEKGVNLGLRYALQLTFLEADTDINNDPACRARFVWDLSVAIEEFLGLQPFFVLDEVVATDTVEFDVVPITDETEVMAV